MTNPAQLRRILGVNDFLLENDLNRTWIVSYYIHIDGETYPVCLRDRAFYACVSKRIVQGNSLEAVRDQIVEVLRVACHTQRP